jgi:hypothetical protein
MDLYEFIINIFREIIFKATKLKYVIVGGIAVIHYSHVRANGYFLWVFYCITPRRRS